MDNQDGVWRTIRGRRVFIKEGESISDAFKKSFNKNKKPESSIEDYEKYKKMDKNEILKKPLVNKDGTINEDVAILGTNPDRDTNPTGNCFMCVPTEMERLRGHDVIALPQDSSIHNDWYKYYKGVNSINDWTFTGRNSGLSQITKDIQKAGDGAVYEIYVRWNNKSGIKGAHVFTGKNVNGKVVFNNSQSTNPEYAFDRKDFFKKNMWGQTLYLRIDDKELKEEYKDKLFKERK